MGITHALRSMFEEGGIRTFYKGQCMQFDASPCVAHCSVALTLNTLQYPLPCDCVHVRVGLVMVNLHFPSPPLSPYRSLYISLHFSLHLSLPTFPPPSLPFSPPVPLHLSLSPSPSPPHPSPRSAAHAAAGGSHGCPAVWHVPHSEGSPSTSGTVCPW